MIDLGVSDYPQVHCAYGVNNSGKVVGQVWAQDQHAFLWAKQYGLKDLGTLGDPEWLMTHEGWAMANDINDRGQVVGSSWAPPTTQQRAFLWSDKGGMVHLGAFVYPSVPPENAYSYAFGRI